MATEDSKSLVDWEQEDIYKLGQLYAVARSEAWEESYRSFQSFANRFKREFNPGPRSGKCFDFYEESMEEAQKAMGIDGEISLDAFEVTNAAIYANNQDPSRNEYRKAASRVLREESDWRSFLEY